MMFKIEYISTFHADVLAVEVYLIEYPQKAKRIFNKLDHYTPKHGSWLDMAEIEIGVMCRQAKPSQAKRWQNLCLIWIASKNKSRYGLLSVI